MTTKERSLLVAGSYEYMETGSINSIQSSLKSHPLWVTGLVSESSGQRHVF